MRIFVVLSRVPYPLDKGDKLRAYYQLKELAKHHEIHLCCMDDSQSDPAAKKHLEGFCKSVHVIPLSKPAIAFNVIVALFSGKPLQTGYFYSRKAEKIIHRLIAEIKPDHIYCQLIRMADYVAHISIPKTLDYQDVFSVGMQRRLKGASLPGKVFFSLEFKRLSRYEQNIFSFFDNKTIITAGDRKLIPHPDRENIHIIPNGVDFDKFFPSGEEKKFDLIFSGNMGYPPNIDSAVFLVREIMPIIWKTRPATTLLIAGATPHPSVLALHADKVTVAGWVPDMRDAYASARIFIAPMRLGTGLQNKLLEAMAMKMPCITSRLSFEALGAVEGKEILVCNESADYAASVNNLLNHEDKAAELALAGFTFVKKNYDWQATTALLEKIIQTTPNKHI